MIHRHILVGAAMLALALPALAQQIDQPSVEPGTVAFLGVSFLDTSTEGAFNGTRQDETARMDLLAAAVRDRMTEEGFSLVDTEPVFEDLETVSNIADCNGCDLALARDLGADYALTGQVQKVSNLILSIKLMLRDVATGEMVRGQSVDIRSNTDESWLRGVSYILRNHFFRS